MKKDETNCEICALAHEDSEVGKFVRDTLARGKQRRMEDRARRRQEQQI